MQTYSTTPHYTANVHVQQDYKFLLLWGTGCYTHLHAVNDGLQFPPDLCCGSCHQFRAQC